MQNKKQSITIWSITLGTLALVVVGLIALAKYSAPPVDNRVVPSVNEMSADDHMFGKSDAVVTLVEYGDFQCPACALYFPIIKQVKTGYGDRIRIVFRNYPLPQHKNARVAAYAAEAASLQGKFWEFHDELYDNQNSWANANATVARKAFEGYAQKLGLDMGKFGTDRTSDAVKAKVDLDLKSGIKGGVSATPTFFLNGRSISPQSYDDFKRELDAVLAAS